MTGVRLEHPASSLPPGSPKRGHEILSPSDLPGCRLPSTSFRLTTINLADISKNHLPSRPPPRPAELASKPNRVPSPHKGPIPGSNLESHPRFLRRHQARNPVPAIDQTPETSSVVPREHHLHQPSPSKPRLGVREGPRRLPNHAPSLCDHPRARQHRHVGIRPVPPRGPQGHVPAPEAARTPPRALEPHDAADTHGQRPRPLPPPHPHLNPQPRPPPHPIPLHTPLQHLQARPPNREPPPPPPRAPPPPLHLRPPPHLAHPRNGLPGLHIPPQRLLRHPPPGLPRQALPHLHPLQHEHRRPGAHLALPHEPVVIRDGASACGVVACFPDR